MKVTTCEWPRHRDVPRGPFRECGESLRYDGPDGIRTLVMWSSSRAKMVGPCCWERAGETVMGQAQAMYPEYFEGKYTPHVDTEEALEKERSQRRFAWALADVPLMRVGIGHGKLVRQDNSDPDLDVVPNLRRVE